MSDNNYQEIGRTKYSKLNPKKYLVKGLTTTLYSLVIVLVNAAWFRNGQNFLEKLVN
ncbi:MAG: hypothetical protein ABIH59_02255 [archaeon]